MDIWTTGTARVDTSQLRSVVTLLRLLLGRLLLAQGLTVTAEALLRTEQTVFGMRGAYYVGQLRHLRIQTDHVRTQVADFATRIQVAAQKYDRAEQKNLARAHRNPLGRLVVAALQLVPQPFAGPVTAGVALLPIFGVSRPVGVEGELAARGMNLTSIWMFPTTAYLGSLRGKSPAQSAAMPAAALAGLVSNPAFGKRRIRIVGPDGQIRYVGATSPVRQIAVSRVDSAGALIDTSRSPGLVLGAATLLAAANLIELGSKGQTINHLFGKKPAPPSPTCAVEVNGALPSVPTALTASTMADRLSKIKNCGPDSPGAHVEVLKHVNKVGKVSWTVNIRGMETFASGGRNPLGMQTNLQAVAGMETDQQRIVESALDQAGARGEPVELVGHSQGSAVATSLAADPVFTRKYNVKSVLAVAGPTRADTARRAASNGVDVLFVRDTSDAVPGLDGHSVDPQLPSLVADTTDAPARNPHGMDNYRNILVQAQKRGVPYLEQWTQRRNNALGLDSDTETRAYEFFAERMPPQVGG